MTPVFEAKRWVEKAPAGGSQSLYPYLLRKLDIERSNQVWALDTTYISMARGFAYLTAVVDVANRKVLAHTVATTLEALHAKEVIEQAFARCGVPGIVNADRGSQFTAEEFTKAVLAKGCKLSMDECGAWRARHAVHRPHPTLRLERSAVPARRARLSRLGEDQSHHRQAPCRRPHSCGARGAGSTWCGGAGAKSPGRA